MLGGIRFLLLRLLMLQCSLFSSVGAWEVRLRVGEVVFVHLDSPILTISTHVAKAGLNFPMPMFSINAEDLRF
jgi:hypothetical protein